MNFFGLSRAHQGPVERHGDRGTLAGTRRERRHRGGHAIVAQIVEVDAAGTVLPGHVHGEAARVLQREAPADLLGEGLCGPPVRAPGIGRQRGHDMQPLAAGCLAKGGQPETVQPLTQHDGGLDHQTEQHVGRGIEVEDQAARKVRIAGLAVPRVQFDAAELGNGGQALNPVDLQIGFATARDRHEFKQIGRAGPGVALKERFRADPVRRANHGAGSPLDVLNQPIAHRFIVAGKVGLGDRWVLVRPQGLVGARDRHAHHDEHVVRAPRAPRGHCSL